VFDFTASPLPVRRDLADAFRDVWDRLAAPGTWWSAEQRIAIASVARAAYDGGEPRPHPNLPEPATAAAALLSAKPSAATPELIAQWTNEGLDSYGYVELIGVVSQVTVVDTFHRAMGLPLEPLPRPEPGEPSRTIPDPAPTLTKAWVPMVGPPTIPTSLSAVPAEMEALEALHGPAYLTFQEMSDPAIQKGLSRAQIELVASRTSSINECFF
jgi:alkylhydroperoxidase family enzyme